MSTLLLFCYDCSVYLCYTEAHKYAGFHYIDFCISQTVRAFRYLVEVSYCTYHVLFWGYSRLWGQQLLWGSNHSGHDTVVERCFLLSGLLQDLGIQMFREGRDQIK